VPVQILISIIAGIIALTFLFLIGYRRVTQGKAMMKRGRGVYFQYYWQLPGTTRYDGVDLTLKKVAVECRDEKALVCADGISIEMRMVALIRVRPEKSAVQQVADNYGTNPEAESRMLEQLEHALEKAVRDSGKQTPSLALVEHEAAFKQQVTQRLGLDKTGFQMDSLALEFVDPELLTKTKFKGN
jgi:uncharacterized membrane protein YqiK